MKKLFFQFSGFLETAKEFNKSSQKVKLYYTCAHDPKNI